MTDRIEKTVELNAPVERVWRALTDHEQFGEWFRARLHGPFTPGQPTRGNILSKGFEHIALEVVTVAMEEPSLFSFTWHPFAIDPAVDYSAEPSTLVEFRLTPTAQGTRLVVTESGFDALPAHRRDEAFRMNDGGWTQQVRNVQAYVES